MDQTDKKVGDYVEISQAQGVQQATTPCSQQERQPPPQEEEQEHGCCYRCCARIGRMIYFASF